MHTGQKMFLTHSGQSGKSSPVPDIIHSIIYIGKLSPFLAALRVQLLFFWKSMMDLKRGTQGDLENCTFFPLMGHDRAGFTPLLVLSQKGAISTPQSLLLQSLDLPNAASLFIFFYISVTCLLENVLIFY